MLLCLAYICCSGVALIRFCLGFGFALVVVGAGDLWCLLRACLALRVSLGLFWIVIRWWVIVNGCLC